MNLNIQNIIKERYSVRIYRPEAIAEETQSALTSYLETLHSGPFGSRLRFSLVAASEQDRASLRGLGTYGTIKNAAGFIIGAVQQSERDHEDYGYAMEQAILHATALGLGTCWLGGSFTQSSFAGKIGKRNDEIIPAVTAAGYAAADSRTRDRGRKAAHADTRLPWEKLFFASDFNTPLSPADAGAYAEALEMLRIGPSASNKQPWRVIKDGNRWHFYCQRTPGYGKGVWYFTLLRIADLQRVDIGIAMCHFELTARQHGLGGAWMNEDPALPPVDEKTLYIATWVGEG